MANLAENSLRRACYRGGFADSKYLYFGTSNDVSMAWDGTDFDMLPAANNSVLNIGNGTLSFDVKTFGSAAANYLLWDASANKLSGVGATILEFGTSSAKIVDDTAGRRFLSMYTDCGATSGDSYGIRAAHYITGAGGGGAAMRPYAIVTGVAASNVYGVEATAELSTTASSSVTGELCAVKARVNINQTTAGTVQPLNLLISTAASKTMHANSAFIGIANEGDGADIANLFYISDAIGTTSAATIVSTSADSTATHTVKMNAAGTTLYLLATTTAPH